MSIFIPILSYLAATFGGATTAYIAGLLLIATIKGSVLLLLAWAINRLALRNAAASSRHLVWVSALGGMLLMPVFDGLVPSIQVKGLPSVSISLQNEIAGPMSSGFAATPRARIAPRAMPDTARPFVATTAPRAIEQTVMPVGSSQGWTIAQWIPLIWLGVALLVLLRLVLGTWRLSLWSRRAQPVDDGDWLVLVQRLAGRLRIARPVTLLRSERACVPMTWGVVYPTVLLPIDADEWPNDRRTIVLLHELAHVKRLDAFTQLVAQLATGLFWFNPLVWTAARQMRIEREHACDDCVLEGGARASDYANDLLQIARSLGKSSAPAAASLAMARRSEIEGRLLAILDPKTNRRSVSRARLAVATLGVLLLSLPLAALTPAQESDLPVAAVLADTMVPRVHETPGATPVAVLSGARPMALIGDTLVAIGDQRERASLAPSGLIATTPIPPVATVSKPPFSFDQLQLPGVTISRRPGTPPDRETLVAVAKAAAKMTSDYEKAELLLEIAKHYIRDDELRTVYLDAVTSMSSDYDRGRTLLPLMLKDDLPAHALSQVVKVASLMTSDNSKANVLVETITKHTHLTPTIQDAVIAAAKGFSSDYERGRTVTAIVKRGDLTNGQIVDLIGVTSDMASSYSKATALLEISNRFGLSDEAVRKAFIKAAGTLTSDTDYRRVMAGVLK